MFYDGPERPAGIFDDFFDFLEVPIIETSASFLELLKLYPSSNPFAGNRLVILPLSYPTFPGKIKYCVERTLAPSLSCSILHRFSK
jgi:hypothetical protein